MLRWRLFPRASRAIAHPCGRQDRSLPGVLLVVLASACSASVNHAGSAPAAAQGPGGASAQTSPLAPPPPPASVPSAPSPAPAPPPGPTARPAPTQALVDEKAADARMELTVEPPRARIGDEVEVTFTNVDDHALRFWQPGASNGCGPPAWQLSLAARAGGPPLIREEDLPGGCGQGVVPARWIVIPPGEAVKWKIDTGGGFHRRDQAPDPLSPKLRKLTPGTYEITAVGAGKTGRAVLALSR
jgi:hypothetical protein